MNMPVMQQKAIADAAPHELRAYATTFLNLDLTGSENDVEILAAIQRAQPNIETIFVLEMPQSDEPAFGTFDAIAEEPSDRIAGSLGRSDPRVVINIPFTGEDTIGRADVPVGVNGVVWGLKRGQNCTVPWRVVEALGLTLQDIVRHDMEKDEVIVTQAMRYPIQFPEGRPSADVIKAWHEATDDAFCP